MSRSICGTLFIIFSVIILNANTVQCRTKQIDIIKHLPKLKNYFDSLENDEITCQPDEVVDQNGNCQKIWGSIATPSPKRDNLEPTFYESDLCLLPRFVVDNGGMCPPGCYADSDGVCRKSKYAIICPPGQRPDAYGKCRDILTSPLRQYPTCPAGFILNSNLRCRKRSGGVIPYPAFLKKRVPPKCPPGQNQDNRGVCQEIWKLKRKPRYQINQYGDIIKRIDQVTDECPPGQQSDINGNCKEIGELPGTSSQETINYNQCPEDYICDRNGMIIKRKVDYPLK